MRAFNDVDLHAFVDGQCSPDRQAAIAAYLATAPGDAARVAAWRRQKNTIKELFSAASAEPVPLWLTVGQIAPARLPNVTVANDPVPLKAVATKVRPQRLHGPLNGWAVALLAFAAGVTVATCTTRFSPWNGPAPVASEAFLKRAVEAQTTFGSDPDRPVDVADVPPGRVRAWLDTRVSFRAKVPDLHALGWTLLGARLTPTDTGPAAFLVYTDANGGRLSFFAGQTTAVIDDRQTEGVSAWTKDGIGYAWMSDRGDWLQRNGAALRGAVDTASTD